MTRRLTYTKRARTDLADIATSIAIAVGDRTAGTGFTAKIRDRCRSFAALPGILGTARPEIAVGLRSFPFRGYVILFRYLGNSLEIVNVLNGRRDFQAVFGEEDGA